jgi:uncharacterized caspase-like protein
VLHAVLIGVDTYRDPTIQPLRFAAADAEALASVLDERVDGNRVITVLTNAEATKERVARVLTTELPRGLSTGDTVFLYFACHGSPDLASATAAPSLQVVLHDTEFEHLASSSINVGTELCAWLRRLEASAVTVVFDASFNGAPGGRSFEGPGLWSGPRTRRLDRTSVSRLHLGYPCALIGACGDKEVAREEAALGHGVFTYHLLKLLRGPAFAGSVSTPRLYRELAQTMQEETGGRQNPSFNGASVNIPLFLLRDTAHSQDGASP